MRVTPHISVIFICTGNICRSPMAEGVFQHLVDQAGLAAHFSIASAGTSSWHVGERAHSGTLRVLKQNGIDYDGRAQQISRALLHDYDYVVCMEDEHADVVRSMGVGRGKIVRLLDYAPDQPLRDVPDPYYDNTFKPVYDLVLKGCRGLLDALRQEYKLDPAANLLPTKGA